MNHFFQEIEGWCNFYDLYQEMVRRFPSGSHFVEVGSWKGRSAAFMAVEIENSGKKIRFDLVDIMTETIPLQDVPDRVDIFLERHSTIKKNLSPVPWVRIVPKASEEASGMYKDEMLDFVYIDADHHYPNVISDIKCWLPKVKYNGVIAGHDYFNYPDVMLAVKELLPEHVVFGQNSWLYRKL
jgi:predicted O-methyltransferase YrrM